LRHARIELWSRGSSPIHSYHPLARILAAAVLLICIATLGIGSSSACALYFALLAATAIAARLPLFEVLLRATIVLPFALCFAVISALAGEPERAAMLLARSYLSALATLLLIATTPLPALFAGLETLRLPRFLLLVMQFLYRYLVVLGGEAAAMRDAARSRGGVNRSLEFRQAAGAAGVLFARSYSRAEAIHQAMVSRGFTGRMPAAESRFFASQDGAFLLVAAGLAIIVRVNFA
jgi:cobalt/nickel transport system permease protein